MFLCKKDVEMEERAQDADLWGSRGLGSERVPLVRILETRRIVDDGG